MTKAKMAATISMVILLAMSQSGYSADDVVSVAVGEERLAKQLANPVSALIRVPFELNHDASIGPKDKGDRFTLNIQPVVPISLSDDWNLISLTILPVISQNDIIPGSGRQTGIGDIVQSLLFTPKAPTDSGWILGVGPVFLFPTGSDNLLTTDKWGAGPTAVALRQQGPWTYGGLVNHLWSFAGKDARSDVNATFMQPFVTYTNKDAMSITGSTEATYDWESEQWAVPVIAMVRPRSHTLGARRSTLAAACATGQKARMGVRKVWLDAWFSRSCFQNRL